MNIVLLGSGNVATHLGLALVKAGHRIVQVFSRTKPHAESLALAVGAEAVDELDLVGADADFYIVAVKDDAIHEVISQLPRGLSGAVVHTAGSMEMNVLSQYATHYGVLYPVQTFSKVKAVDFSSTPVAIEASDELTYDRLNTVASSLSNRIFPCNSKQRLSLHVAAVFACNFTNLCYAIGADILSEHELDFSLIRPLISETAEKVMIHLPREVQTGPAIRNDVKTMGKHWEALRKHPGLQDLYVRFSELINAHGQASSSFTS